MYEETKTLVEANGYAVRALRLPVGGKTHTLWGPDVTGRFCRMGAYMGLSNAVAAFRTLAKVETAEIRAAHWQGDFRGYAVFTPTPNAA